MSVVTMKTSGDRTAWVKRYGPWAVVTGASDGIGRALALTLAERGVNVFLVGRDQQRLDAVSIAAEKFGVASRALSLDLTQRKNWEALASATRELDVGLLVANAGFGLTGSLIDADIDEELSMLSLNCGALLYLSHLFGRRLADRGSGGILLMSSLFAFQGVPKAANYAATKAYVQSLAEALRVELAPSGVDVLACAPGPVRSGFAARAGMRMGFAQTPAQIAPAILDALGRQGTVRPGFLSQALEAAFIGQPRWMRSWILAKVVEGMIKPTPAKEARS